VGAEGGGDRVLLADALLAFGTRVELTFWKVGATDMAFDPALLLGASKFDEDAFVYRLSLRFVNSTALKMKAHIVSWSYKEARLHLYNSIHESHETFGFVAQMSSRLRARMVVVKIGYSRWSNVPFAPDSIIHYLPAGGFTPVVPIVTFVVVPIRIFRVVIIVRLIGKTRVTLRIGDIFFFVHAHLWKRMRIRVPEQG
jgi:hypothetical protein